MVPVMPIGPCSPIWAKARIALARTADFRNTRVRLASPRPAQASIVLVPTRALTSHWKTVLMRENQQLSPGTNLAGMSAPATAFRLAA